MSPADKALVYFSPKAVAHKKLPALSAADVHRHFADERITVSTETGEVVHWLQSVEGPAVFLIMTSGNFDGQNLEVLAKGLV
jgi:UDP-N-acetylmuramate: L-alanyl-gamma-D-glutamyl-meso-diaminopimelate ligase